MEQAWNFIVKMCINPNNIYLTKESTGTVMNRIYIAVTALMMLYTVFPVFNDLKITYSNTVLKIV